MTAKRATVEVDEDSLKELMAMEIPVLRKESFKHPHEKPAEEADTSGECIEPKDGGRSAYREMEANSGKKAPLSEADAKNTGRRKKETAGYSDAFLRKSDGVVNHRVYITEENFQKVISFLPILSREIMISHFINNMLTHHLDAYKNEINDLIQKNYKMPTLC